MMPCLANRVNIPAMAFTDADCQELVDMDLVDLFQRGGWAMYPILFCSLAAVTVFLERLWSLRLTRLIPRGFVQTFRDYVAKGRLADAGELCELNAGSPLARVARAGLTHHGQGADTVRFMISEIGSLEAVELERNQTVLRTVAYLCPLLGLFGTVSGMIKAFDVISRHTVVDPPMLAAGISEALITTFAGLAVAIPVVVMDRYVQSRSNRISFELEKKSVEITEALIQESSDGSALKLAVPSR